MNQPMQIPQWAEAALQKPSKFDATEFRLLREFFEKWVAFHAIKKDKAHRKQQEQGAAELLQAAKAIEGFRRPAIMNGAAHGTS